MTAAVGADGTADGGGVESTAPSSGMIRAMRAVIVAANWKMHTTPADAGELARDDRRRGRASRASSASSARRSSAWPRCATRSRAATDVAVGAQNVHHELPGAYTGEVSAPMLVGLATWVIVGHSRAPPRRRRDRRA